MRKLKEIGHDWVSIWICVWKDDLEPEYLRLHITERNTTIYGGKEWRTTFSVPLAWARIGQNMHMNLFAEHVAEYAKEPL